MLADGFRADSLPVHRAGASSATDADHVDHIQIDSVLGAYRDALVKQGEPALTNRQFDKRPRFNFHSAPPGAARPANRFRMAFRTGGKRRFSRAFQSGRY